MKRTILIELDDPNDETSGAELEREVGRLIKPMLKSRGLEVTHLEASSGDMERSFGIRKV